MSGNKAFSVLGADTLSFIAGIASKSVDVLNVTTSASTASTTTAVAHAKNASEIVVEETQQLVDHFDVELSLSRETDRM